MAAYFDYHSVEASDGERLGITSLNSDPASQRRKDHKSIISCVSLLALATFFFASEYIPFRGQDYNLRGETSIESVHVLLTGFKPFLNYKTNPAGQVASILNGTCHRASGAPEICFTGMQVEVSRDGVQKAVQHAHAGPYDIILHIGYESVAKGLKLEGFAANILGAEHQGWSSSMDEIDSRPGQAIDGALPWLLPTTAPLSCPWLSFFQEYTRSDHARNVTTLWSRDAGAYYCNELYFRSLEADLQMDQSEPLNCVTPTLFVHVPPPDLVDVIELGVIIQDIALAMARCTQPGCIKKAIAK
mmetsp:Transcript_24308/g.54826  ORF Transcript_24308/g.54826 Transcript_24308/m.54826 type:complete len:302 (+) Transcript_24308:306-1211(+)|eukprot:CAMPEP_0172631604 /NCGR_PEP_ID=MMETSP1068-20121228/180107_1 /TAXON_ID=35684 /ORGANISM="Pseudopedinella elastica, Strain CCMP716" /LENGTH=301 /DNA_ID=CAMNT_0013442793 /DNA_START=243 /DNA_END=1148 /DNA_ORIENTATION=+